MHVMKLLRRQFLHLAAGAAAMPTFSRSLWAQAYPTSPIRFVVPLAAGGGLDFVARLVGEYLTHSIGQQVYIENKTGAGGTIGIDAAAKSAPDGYTVLIGSDNLGSLPHIMKVNIDYAKVLVPVIALSRQPQVLATHPSLGVGSIGELIAAAKRRPGLGFATSGVGTNQHFVGEWFARLTGIKLEHVPYRGAGQAVNDLLAGHVPIGVLGPTALIPHYEAGNVRLLAQTSETRAPSMPKVPTLPETGVDLVLPGWIGAFVPAGTPFDIVARLNAEMEKALGDPASRASFAKAVHEPLGGSPERLAKLLHDDSAKYAKLAVELNIRIN
jgi:tripartite-type tricarboxylate transporter receptor subunit TctC